jgi:O-antigen chain-terminating methyltransferase
LDSEHPDLPKLRSRLEEEEAEYARLLSALDALASFPLPAEKIPELPERLAQINDLWRLPARPEGGGIAGALRTRAWDALAPALERQQAFNSLLVQVLNRTLDETALLHAHLRNLVAALVRYLQRVLPVMDARDRAASALATTRAELILEAFDRRQEALARRLEGLLALRDRLESVSEEVRALRGALEAGPPPEASVAEAVSRAARDSVYAAFENRFRGALEEIRERFTPYVELFRGLAPVVDLGCGRGEFLELLRDAGVAAHGVESNARFVRECRERGLDVAEGDLVAFLRGAADGSLGGVFAAQVAEHLPPPVLQEMLREVHRALRPGGLLVLETVNPRSVVGFLEVYNRDLTHERPLHPETLTFLAAACGFTDVRVELKTPVEPAARLQEVPPEGLPPAAVRALNENIARLNELLYGPQEYALLARR